MADDADGEDDHSRLPSGKNSRMAIPIHPCFVEGPYGHDPLAHHYESVLLICGGSGVSFGISILLDLVRRARNRDLGGEKRLVTTRLTWVWTVRETGMFVLSWFSPKPAHHTSAEQIEWATSSLRDALYYAPAGFLELAVRSSFESHTGEMLTLGSKQVYVTGGSRRDFTESQPPHGSTLPRSNTLVSGSSSRSSVSGLFPLPPLTEEEDKEDGFERAARSSNTTPFLLDSQSLATPPTSSTSISRSVYSHAPSLQASTAPTSLTTSAEHGHDDPPSLPRSYPPLTPPIPHPAFESSLPPPPSLHTPIPLNYHRPPIREILDAVISSTTYSGSVLVGTCGPTALTDEVGAAVSDAIRPRKVWEGEFRRNVVSFLVSWKEI